LAVAGFAIARDRTITRVSIKGDNGDFHGKVFSSKGRCLGGRDVTVYKATGSDFDPENDTEIGSDTTERSGDVGVWSIGNSGFKHGDVYARIHKTFHCKGDVSRMLHT